ncbi:MAG: Gfo/Idh/MocA family oxidoreductase [Planctomycetes bacterium]|nr:Gfo/Idh/MocA family oxidoreductase [Planctomycetota bacterium]
MSRAKVSRRRFLRRTAAAGLSAWAMPAFIPRRVLSAPGRPGANDRVHLGVIGTGIRGKYLIGSLPGESRVVAICDSYLPRVADTLKPTGRDDESLAAFRESDAPHCTGYQDYRRLIDNETLDGVMIATPDHHHVLAAMLACQAGLDVYVEKPLSLTIAEGRALVETAKRHGRVCQVGSQNRTMEINRYGCQLIRNGGIGRISLVEMPNYPGPMADADFPEQPIPDGLNWDLFCGPRPLAAHNRKRWVKDEFRVDGVLWRGWDLLRDYSGHLMTNWGAHSVDMVQSALGMERTGPVEIWPILEGHQGPRRTCPLAMRYASGVEIRFVLRLVDKWTFHGEKGKALMRRNLFETDPPELMVDPPDFEEALKPWNGVSVVPKPHIENWLACIKTRGTPNAPLEIGHRSVTACHLAGIARELGRKVCWDPDREIFPSDDQANALLDRSRRPGWELPVA